MDGRHHLRFSVQDDSMHDVWQSKQNAPKIDFKPVRPESDHLSISRLMNADSPVVRPDEVSRAMKRRSTINLHKSIALLDEAVGTPAALLGAQRTPHSLSATPIGHPVDSRFDVSATFGASMLATPRNSTRLLGREGIIDSVVRDSARNKSDNQMMISDDVTTTNVALLLEEDPGIAACTGAYADFLACLSAHPGQQGALSLVSRYEHVCTEHAQLLHKLVKRAVPGQDKFLRTADTLDMITQERKVWSLIHSLYNDRLSNMGEADDEPMLVDMLGKTISDKQVMNSAFNRDTQLRQSQIVVDWLERNAEEALEDVYDHVEFFADQMGAWENTLHQLINGKPIGSERKTVTELDPDAPIRQKAPLADLDQEDELRLLRHMLACVRAGKLEEAQKLCVRAGQPWRAATLEGWRLYHDPNCEGLGPGGTIQPTEGNPSRDVWKATCWRLATQERLPVVERALYAALSGHLRALLPVCHTWEDHLWAHLRTLVDRGVEGELRDAYTLQPGSGTLCELPQEYWDKRFSLETVFTDIQASPYEEVRAESQGRFNIIKKYIILEDIDSLVEELHEWCKEDARGLPPQLLRLGAHLILFFRSVSATTKEELSVSVLEAYVRYLTEERHTTLVAAYIATLPPQLQTECYAKFLEGVGGAESRQQCLQLGMEAGLDVHAATKLVVENIRCRDSSDFGRETDGLDNVETTEEDREKIDAIEWLVFDAAQRAEALRQANAVMRTFLALRKVPAAKAVFAKLPSSSIDDIIRSSQAKTGSTDLCAEDDNAIREFLCHQAFLDAHDSFNDWFEHYHNNKPTAPQLAEGSTFTERVAYEHREKQFQQDLHRWDHALQLQSKTTVDKIYNVLMFVNGGWMVDQRLDGRRDAGRVHQLRLLRQLCLPLMCVLLHTVLHSTHQYRACLQLADLLASEQYQLYKVFSRSEQQKFMGKLQESAVALLDQGLDSVGYDIV